MQDAFVKAYRARGRFREGAMTTHARFDLRLRTRPGRSSTPRRDSPVTPWSGGAPRLEADIPKQRALAIARSVP